MVPSRNDVIASIRIHFPAENWAQVVELLDTYGVALHEPERERVQLAILKLSAGGVRELHEYIASAKHDYRDVLYWAEYPEQSHFDTPSRPMRVELALFEGDILLDRSEITIGAAESTDSLKLFHARHWMGSKNAHVVLEDFADHIDIKRSSLDIPIHESDDWESIELGRYTLAFWCRHDA